MIAFAIWMVEEEERYPKTILPQDVEMFTEFSRSPNFNINLQNPSIWFQGHHSFFNPKAPLWVTSNFRYGRRNKYVLKTIGGRGRKRTSWVEWLHGEIIGEFESI